MDPLPRTVPDVGACARLAPQVSNVLNCTAPRRVVQPGESVRIATLTKLAHVKATVRTPDAAPTLLHFVATLAKRHRPRAAELGAWTELQTLCGEAAAVDVKGLRSDQHALRATGNKVSVELEQPDTKGAVSDKVRGFGLELKAKLDALEAEAARCEEIKRRTLMTYSEDLNG